jgi:predicted nucleic acid-binding protein
MRFYLDANFIVYCIEGTPALKEFCLPRLREVEAHPGGSLLASRLSRVEVLVKPMRLKDAERTARFQAFFSSRDIDLVDVSKEIVERALDLRVKTKVKLVDALHVATAVEHRATLFLTGDKEICALGQIETVSFELIPVD